MTETRERQLTIAIAQMDIELGNWEANLRRAAKALAQASESGADVVLLPELWSSGFDLDRSRMYARLSAEEVVPQVERLAREHGVAVVGSLLMEDDRGRVVNRALVLDRTGRTVGWYDKVHLFSPMDEDRFLSAGASTPIFQLAGVETALAVCYDLRFPELFRRYAFDGAAIVLLPAEWPASRLTHWRTLVRARAIENQLFVAACNRVGTSKETLFGGHSTVINPWGTIVTEAGDDEMLLLATLNLSAVQEARAKLHTLDDRRPDVYDAPAPMARTA